MRKAIVTCCGLGYLPIAPGTWGSAGAIVVAGAVYLALGGGAAFDGVIAGLAVIATVVGVALGRWSVAAFESGDPKPFVIDEAAGQWIALIAMPVVGLGSMAGVFALQFVLFRVADIVKPPPARQLERLPHGWGIVFDDLAAGVYANLVGQLILRWGLGLG